MRYLLVGLALIASGCGHCGTFSHQTGLEWDDPTDDEEPEPLDEIELYEACGAESGSFGSVDLIGDGLAWIAFDGTHRKLHESLITSGITNEVFFPTEQLVAGTTVDIVEAYAYYTDMGGNTMSGAEFSEGTVEILEVDDEIDEIWNTQPFRVRWDLVWGEPGVSEFWYVTSGEDWIELSHD